MGAEGGYYVPHRLEEGYGVNADAVRKIIADGAKLIVTVDCGIGAAEPLAVATAAGVDVVVSDHHTPQAGRPDVAAIVHPGIEGSEYPNPALCGAGVAFKLAWQTLRTICGRTRVDDEMKQFLLNATCLAALGTIADVVPLLGENRVLATFGLRGLAGTSHVGLRALLTATNLAETALDAYHVGFVLAPRLNAAGRLGKAELAIELLTTDDPARARELAEQLDRQNTERQQVERRIVDEAVAMVEQRGLDREEHRAIVLASENWHSGVIGIVASRLIDRFHKPAVMIALEQEAGQGSGRSIAGFDMAAALAACGEHLLSFGGHAMAGGLRVACENVDAFSDAFARYAAENIRDEQLVPALAIDAETTVGALGLPAVQQLERMGPFGQKNPRPVVAIRGCRVLGAPKRMGRTGQTVSMILRQGEQSLRAVGFGMGDLADHLAAIRTVDVAGRPSLNTFNGRTTVELHLSDVTWE